MYLCVHSTNIHNVIAQWQRKITAPNLHGLLGIRSLTFLKRIYKAHYATKLYDCLIIDVAESTTSDNWYVCLIIDPQITVHLWKSNYIVSKETKEWVIKWWKTEVSAINRFLPSYVHT